MNIEEILNTMDYGTAPEDTSPALKWLDAREWTIKPFINGEFDDNDTPVYFDTINPQSSRALSLNGNAARNIYFFPGSLFLLLRVTRFLH